MKKIFILIATVTVLVNSGCKKFVEGYNVDPNNPTEVPLTLLLPTCIVATEFMYTQQLSRTASILTQQLAGTDFQMVEINDYAIQEDDNINEWKGAYADALINQKTLINEAGSENPYYRGIGRILKVMTIGITTDYWGDVPYSNALQAFEENYTPTYDSQESIIASMQDELSAAIADLSQDPSSNRLLPGFDDLVHGGDVDAWIQDAYILKARYANRLSKKDPQGSAQRAVDILNESNLDPTRNMYALFEEGGNNNNPYASFNATRANYIKMGQFLVALMDSLNDPRLPLYASPDNNGEYTGSAPDEYNTEVSNTGDLYTADGAPIPMVTYWEAKFIEAEAKLRLGDNQGAADAHNEAVTANLEATVGAADPDYVAANASETSSSINLEKIMTQKYIAMFLQPEVWADWRRTGFPNIAPNPNGVVPGIPRRLPTTLDERLYNPSAQVVSNILQPVWWDAP